VRNVRAIPLILCQGGETRDNSGNVLIASFTIEQSEEGSQMQLNKNVMQAVGPCKQEIPCVGDKCFEVGRSMMIQKGDRLIRITYTACPCNTDAIVPLAQKLMAAL
jgi:hypothetical protein